LRWYLVRSHWRKAPPHFVCVPCLSELPPGGHRRKYSDIRNPPHSATASFAINALSHQRITSTQCQLQMQNVPSPYEDSFDFSTAVPVSIRRRRNCRRHRNPHHVPPRCRQNPLPTPSDRRRGTVHQHARLCPENRAKRRVKSCLTTWTDWSLASLDFIGGLSRQF
jgi:hypothetical protein